MNPSSEAFLEKTRGFCKDKIVRSKNCKTDPEDQRPQTPHVLLASYAGTVMGVETYAMQFYPEASAYEAKVHPGLYRRLEGKVQLGTIKGDGFGYNAERIARPLPAPAACY